MPIIGARVCRPLPTVEAWADRLASLDIPVLGSTAESLERLRAEEDDIDAHSIAEAMSSDPLMALKILVHAGSHQGKRVVTDAETVTEALADLVGSATLTAVIANLAGGTLLGAL